MLCSRLPVPMSGAGARHRRPVTPPARPGPLPAQQQQQQQQQQQRWRSPAATPLPLPRRPVGAARAATAAPSDSSSSTTLPLLERDPGLRPYEDHLSYRWRRYLEAKAEIEQAVAGGAEEAAGGVSSPSSSPPPSPLARFADSYLTWGLQRARGATTLREWIPGASAVALIGDFNGWQPRDGLDWAQKDAYGVWTLSLPDDEAGGGGAPAVPHGSRFKLRVQSASGGWWADRVSAWVRYAVAPQGEMAATYDGVAWWPPENERHAWRHPRPTPLPASFAAAAAASSNSSSSSAPLSPHPALRVYEAHVGMSSEREEVATYAHFADVVLPRVKAQGYNAVQLMAVQEHAYYASFGYHVTSPFAVSSRSGTPEDLKRLVDAAHAQGLRVLLDIVHSHASKNEADGVAGFDLGGGEGCLVRVGDAGYHAQWDSRVYSYERLETRRFLLSNLKYWVCEMGFDGFRFDGVTSMLYQHHGIGVGFSGDYHEYFGLSTDVEACVYLMLANEMAHGLVVEGGGQAGKAPAGDGPRSPSSSSPPPPSDVLTIAEDVSGMPGLCAPVPGGGLGFDARLAMAAPDLWIRLLKHVPDEGWPVSQIVATLCGRRYGEGRVGTVGYSESHDQAMVGDKTVAMWLFGPEIYTGMSALAPASPVIERGVGLHKTISAATAALGGEARMTFMGNEFGHPEWIDFPTAQNGWSHAFARRQWSLADRDDLRYAHLLAWDRALNACDDAHGYVSHATQWATLVDDARQLIVAERGPLLWVFNFSPSLAHGALRVPCPVPGKWRVALDSDAECFGGQGRVPWRDYFSSPADEEQGGEFCGRGQWLEVVSPPRTALAFVRVREEEVGVGSGDGASEAIFPPRYAPASASAAAPGEEEEGGVVVGVEPAAGAAEAAVGVEEDRGSAVASEQTVVGEAAGAAEAGEVEEKGNDDDRAAIEAAAAAPSSDDGAEGRQVQEDSKQDGGKGGDDDKKGPRQRGDYVVFRF